MSQLNMQALPSIPARSLFLLLFFGLLPITFFGQIVPSDCCDNTTPVVCDLSSTWSGNTLPGFSSCTPTGFPGFCGSIENNGWMYTYATGTSMTFTYNVGTCSGGNGVQLSIYTSTNQNSPCTSLQYNAAWCTNCNGGQTCAITVTGLTCGERITIMWDGFAGAICPVALTVTSATGCSGSGGSSGTGALDSINAVATPAIACEGSTVQLLADTFLTTTPTGPFLYNWSIIRGSSTLSGTNIPNPTAVINSNTTFLVTVDDTADVCPPLSDTINVIVPSMEVIPPLPITCPGQGQPILSFLADSVSWNWTPATGLSCTNCPDPIWTGDTTTQYIVVATDIHGCTHRDTIIAEYRGLRNASFDITPESCPGANDGGIIAHPRGGQGDLDTCIFYSFDASNTLPDIGAGLSSYSSNMNAATFQAAGNGPSVALVHNNAAQGGVTNHYSQFTANTTGKANLVANLWLSAPIPSGPANATFQYSTTGVGGPFTTFAAFPVPLFTGVGTGGYVGPFNLTGIPGIDNNPNVVFRIGFLNGGAAVSNIIIDNFTLTAPSTNPNYIFTWSPNPAASTDSTQLNVGSGTYFVTIDDGNGCTIVDTAIVTVGGGSTNRVLNDTICTGTSTTFNGQTLTMSGTYLDTILGSGAGCDTLITYNLFVQPLPTPTISGSATYCTGGSTTLDAGAGFSGYLWSAPVASGANGAMTQTITVSTAGTYSVTVTDAQGCDGVASLMVSTSGSLNPTIVGNNIVCAGDTAFLDAGSFTGYSWSPGGQTSRIIAVTTPGVYSVTVTDASGCTGNDSETVTVLTVPPVTNLGPFTICDNDSVTVNGVVYNSSGFYFDTLVAANGCDSVLSINLIVLATSSETITSTICTGDSLVVNGVVLNTTTIGYMDTIFGGNANGCDSFITVNLTVVPQVLVSISGPTSYCIGNNATLTATGGYASYMWTAPPASGFNGHMGQSLSTNVDGQYIVVVADANGCTGTDTIEITSSLTVFPNILGQSIICTGTSSFLDAGAGYASYLWSPGGQMTQTRTATSGGQYVVRVTDVAGCIGFDTINITVNTTPAPVFQSPTICIGDSFYVGANLYTSGGFFTDTLGAANGCDSIVVTNLMTVNAVVTNLTPTICTGASTTINGTVYNAGNLTGADTLVALSNGCDSIVNVALSFHPASTNTINPTLCPGGSVTVNGTLYNQGNPTGMEVVANGSSNGCDSTITISLSFHAASTNTINPTLCPGGSVTVNGTLYNQGNLTFHPPAVNNITATLCFEDSIISNGTTYNRLNPMGTEVISGASGNGCDSTVNINLTFNPQITNTINPTLCFGGSMMVNGTLYNAANASGTEVATAADGCDSTITVSLSFHPNNVVTFDPTLCFGQSVVINGTTYNQGNPMGQEILVGADQNGCDSTININLSFQAAAINNISQTLCPGGSVTANGVLYNAGNAMGSDTIVNGSAAGCDSIINVNLSFHAPSTNTINPTLCPGGSVTVNGTLYNQGIPITD